MRKTYDDLVRRDVKIELPPEVTGSTDPVEFQSANLEKDIFDHMAVLTMNPTMFDAIVLDPSTEARKLEKKLGPGMARWWTEMNPNRVFDRMVGEGQVRHGVKFPWLCWREQKAKVGDDGKSHKRNPFYWKNTNLYGCFWTENDGEADVFYYRFTKPVLEAEVYKENKGKKQKVTLDNMGKVGWLDLDVEHDSAVEGKKIDVIVRDGRDLSGKMCEMEGCKFGPHPRRKIAVYVCAEGSNDEWESVEEYDSPFPGCSFFIVGGNISYHETDFHQKYRPMILPAYNQQYFDNYITTLMATEARQAHGDEDVYIDGSTIPPHLQTPEGGWQQGIDRPKAGSNQIPVYPGTLSRWPKNIDPHLMQLKEKSDMQMAEYRPNRFLSGTAYTEASNATGSAYLAGLQQAGLPYNDKLGSSDYVIKKAFDYMFHALCFWAQSDPEDSPTLYGVALSGEENVRRFAGTHKPGEMIFINPKELQKYDIDIILKTESKTHAEEQANWLLGWDKYQKGVYTKQDLMKSAGIFDLAAQDEALFRDYVRETMIPDETALIKLYLRHRASAYTGMDFGAAIQSLDPGMAPQGPQSDQSMGENNLLVPPNAQMGRSATQLEMAASLAGPTVGGGSSPI